MMELPEGADDFMRTRTMISNVVQKLKPVSYLLSCIDPTNSSSPFLHLLFSLVRMLKSSTIFVLILQMVAPKIRLNFSAQITSPFRKPPNCGSI
jgi:hypothetical protein